MNKVKMFFIAAALLLTTAGVFATRAKFVSAGLVAYISAGNYKSIETSTLGADMTTTATGSQAKISDHSGTQYALYQFDGVSTYTPVYSTLTW